ncbi:MAG: energy-coupling factor transporter ATPase [Peptococcia bacterium]
MNEIIRINDLEHWYINAQGLNRQALKGINLQIRPGEFVAVIGHNGSGKSTLAMHLNALLVPDQGSVIINGMDTRKPELLWDIRQQVGMVFQNPDNQLIATVVEDDVAFGPENLGIEPVQISHLVDESLRIVDMSAYRKQAPHLLSGGQKQRVAIAGILAMKPNVMVLDEPTAMLDPAGRAEVMQTVLKLNQEENLTIILITHFMEEAILADRVVVMEEGNIVMDGGPREVFAQVEKIKALGLDVPPMMELRNQLNQAGVQLPADILTVEEMVVALCR